MFLWQMIFNLRRQLEQIAKDQRRSDEIRQRHAERRAQEITRALYEAASIDQQPICPDAAAEAGALMDRLRRVQ